VKLRLIIRPEAEDDIAAARRWYEEQQRGLSIEFRSALDDTFSSITNHPEINRRVYRDMRRALVRRFPYAVFYTQLHDDIVVVAVLHTSRNPRLWGTRYKSRE
jgi:toxin ParE1/3/4